MKRRTFIKNTGKLMATGIVMPKSILAQINNSSEGKVVLITGTSSGFGYHMALTFARAGHNTYASMRNIKTKNKNVADQFLEIQKKEKLNLNLIELDVTKSKQCKEVIDHIISKENKIDILINNAGIFAYCPMEIVPKELWELQMRTNVFGPMELAGLVLPHMRENKSGLIIQVSSRVGRVVIPGISLYCSSKFALETATEGAHYEATSQGIDFAIIQPTAYKTKVNPNARKLYSEFTRPLIEVQRPQGTKFHEDFLNILNNDFSGIPTRNPQEIADLALKISQTPRDIRKLRYPMGDSWEVNPLKEINSQISNMQKSALRGRYENWYRN